MSRQAKRGTTVYTCTIETPLGPMTAAAEDGFLTGLWFAGQRNYPQTTKWMYRKNNRVFLWLRPYLKCYFDGKVGNHDFPVAPEGTYLEQVVWRTIETVPYGRAVSPEAILRGVRKLQRFATVSMQDVQAAIGQNPVAILIPSHRVLGPVGPLDDYPGGQERKEALLAIEGILDPGCVVWRELPDSKKSIFDPFLVAEG